MCTVLLPSGDNPIAVSKYIIYLYTYVFIYLFIYLQTHSRKIIFYLASVMNLQIQGRENPT